MADTSIGSVVMESEDSNESAVNGSEHIEKNGISDDEIKSVKSVHETDITAEADEDSSNFNLDKTEDDDSIMNDDEDVIDSASEVTESKMDETKQLNGAGDESSVTEVSDSVADENNVHGEAMDVDVGCPTNNSEKLVSPKPNAISEILSEEPPKDSPEVIVANLSPFVKDRSESNDVLMAKHDKEDDTAKGEKDDALMAKSDKEDDAVIVKSDDEGHCKTDTTEVADAAEENSDSKEKKSKIKSKGKSKSGKKKKSTKHCEQCKEKTVLQYRMAYQGRICLFCTPVCCANFKMDKKLAPKKMNENCGQCQNKIGNEPGFFPAIGEVMILCSEECVAKYHEKNGKPRNCNHCKKVVESVYNRLSWETMTFCNEECLGKYQSHLGSHCTCCQHPVMQSSLGKYCVCFGADIRQFCSGSCLEDFKKGLKVCSFCQTDLSAVGEGFLAPVGDKGQFKDFCTQQCMERYEVMNNLSKSVPHSQECAHCKKQGSFKIQVKHNDKTHSLCCDICVAGFRCSNQVMENMCGTCFKFFTPSESESFAFTFENLPKHFCTKACMTLFVLSNRKIIQCGQCKVKKYNFDMIEKIDSNNHTNMYCSLNCLSLHRVHLNAASAQKIRCDHCAKNIQAQYHLTMSDGSVRNFCNYDCVVNFQKECLLSAIQTSVTARTSTNTARTVTTKTTSTGSSNPVIANVVSLAQPRPTASPQSRNVLPQTLVSVRPQGPAISVLSPKPQVPSPQVTSTLSVSAAQTNHSGIYNEVIVRPPTPKTQRNKAASVKPIMSTKAVCARMQTCHKAVQTDETQMPAIFPVPIPVYVPSLSQMFTRTITVPMPFPVPIPIPVPVFIKDKSSSKSNEADLLNVATKSAECMKMIEESNKTLSQRLGISTAIASCSESPKEPVNNIHLDPPIITATEPEMSIPQTSFEECESITMPTLVEKANSVDANNSTPVVGKDIITLKTEPMDEEPPAETKPPRKKKRSGEDMIMHEVKRNKMDEELEVNNLKLSGDEEIVIL